MDEKLLSLLVCPACHSPVERREELLVCRGCGRGYPIRNGIPVMLVGEAVRPERGAQGPAAPGEGVREDIDA